MKRILLALMLVVSAAGITSAQDKEKKSPEERAEMLTKKMQKELSLSDDQVAKVKEINLAMAREKEELREKRKQEKQAARSEMKKDKEERDAQMKEVLSAEQYTKFLAMKEEMKEKHKERKEKKK